MKYIIMAGGNYNKIETPKPLLEVNGEKLIERTIRLLKENGIKDIAISTNNPVYNYLGVKILKHNNEYTHDNPDRHKKSKNSWLNAYYPTNEPSCYLPGDIYWSENAIKIIIDTKVENTMFFCIRDVSDGRPIGINIKGREPLAYKVENQVIFRKAINDLFQMIDNGKFKSDPISWNLYRQINGLDLDYNGYGNNIFKTNGDYKYIDDYTTDIDSLKDIPKLERFIKIMKGGTKMVKCEVINQNVTIREFNRLRNIKRLKSNEEIEQPNYFEIGDTFETDEDMASYLAGETPNQPTVCIKVLEIIPEKKEETKEETKYPKKIEKKPITKKSKKVR